MMKEELEQKIAELEAKMGEAGFWDNKELAQQIVREHAELKEQLATGGSGGKYDKSNAIITIFSGAGGDDAEDFSRILFEMYQKFAARRGFELALIHEHQNDHGGYRNLSFLLKGKGAYGILKSESGVHRLVRISPFSAKKLRHTSFSLVEVVPELPKDAEIKIRPEDLKIEFARSSGPGGQNVNKRETAVRIVHLPSGLAAHSTALRSQERNRERALELLRGKLYKRQEAERVAKEQGLYISKTTDIEWGSQVRSYVFHPYRLVKDHRTEVETRDVEGVLNGEIDIFL